MTHLWIFLEGIFLVQIKEIKYVFIPGFEVRLRSNCDKKQ